MARLTPITEKSQMAAKDHPVFDAIVASRGSIHGPFVMFLHCPELIDRTPGGFGCVCAVRGIAGHAGARAGGNGGRA